MTLPSFESYGNYSSHNYGYGVNTLRLWVGGGSIWFSYKTPVAFSTAAGRVVRQNDWGPTTGKHLNWIDGGNKANRIPGIEFEKQLAAAFNDDGWACRIRNPKGDYWSNEFGWVESLTDATIFNAYEQAKASLPMEGFWETN